MAPRAYWKGYLKLSLVSCPVAMYPATSSSERVSFNRINRNTGNRLKQLLVDSETGEPVDKEDISKGYQVAKGEYVLVEDDELDQIRLETTHTISINSFVARDEIDDRYISSGYYIAPTDKVGQEAFAVIRDALRQKKMVALGRVVLARREHVMMLEPFDSGILGSTLRYAYEVRDQASYFEDIEEVKLPAEMKDLANHIVETMTGHFEPNDYEDQYETAVVDLIRQKQAGGTIRQDKPIEEQPRVINLMDALRASVEGETRKKPAATRQPARRAAAKSQPKSQAKRKAAR